MGRYQHVLLGGLFIGVLSALPVVGYLNICCCLWVVCGGLLTTYLLQQNRPAPVESGEAAIGGLLAGILGAVLYLLVQAVIIMVSGETINATVQDALANQQMPPEVRDLVERLMNGPNLMLLSAAITLPVYAAASMLGALLGVAVFKKKTPPPALP
jgi:hypothetical protein